MMKLDYDNAFGCEGTLENVTNVCPNIDGTTTVYVDKKEYGKIESKRIIEISLM